MTNIVLAKGRIEGKKPYDILDDAFNHGTVVSLDELAPPCASKDGLVVQSDTVLGGYIYAVESSDEFLPLKGTFFCRIEESRLVKAAVSAVPAGLFHRGRPAQPAEYENQIVLVCPEYQYIGFPIGSIDNDAFNQFGHQTFTTSSDRLTGVIHPSGQVVEYRKLGGLIVHKDITNGTYEYSSKNWSMNF